MLRLQDPLLQLPDKSIDPLISELTEPFFESSFDSHAFWALVCLGCLFTRHPLPFDSGRVSVVWKFAVRKLQDLNDQPAACFCLAMIIENCSPPEREITLLLGDLADHPLPPCSGSLTLGIALQKQPLASARMCAESLSQILQSQLASYCQFEESRKDMWSPEVSINLFLRYLHIFCGLDVNIPLPMVEHDPLSSALQRELEIAGLYKLFSEIRGQWNPTSCTRDVNPIKRFDIEERAFYQQKARYIGNVMAALTIQPDTQSYGQILFLITAFSLFNEGDIAEIFRWPLERKMPSLNNDETTEVEDVLRHIVEIPATPVFSTNIGYIGERLKMAFNSEKLYDILELMDFVSKLKCGLVSLQGSSSFLAVAVSDNTLVNWPLVWMKLVTEAVSQYSSEDLRAILRKFGSSMLRTYDLQRMEQTGVICLQFLSATSEIWAVEFSSFEVKQDSLDLMSWFLKIVMETGVSSVKIRRALFQLLLKLIGAPSSVIPPGLDAHLVNLISLSTYTDLYELACAMTTEFGKLDFQLHHKLFASINQGLGNLSEVWEELAVRCAIMEASSAGDGAMIESIYNILLMAICQHGEVSARFSLMKVAQNKNLDVRNMFKFVSRSVFQLWRLNNLDFRTFPFSVCGYETKEQFVQDNAMMLSAEVVLSHPDDFEDILGYNYNDILRRAVPALAALQWDPLKAYPDESCLPTVLRFRNFHQCVRDNALEAASEVFIMAKTDRLAEMIRRPYLKSYAVSCNIISDSGLHGQLDELLKRILEQANLSVSQFGISANFLYIYRQVVGPRARINSLEGILAVRKAAILLNTFGRSALSQYTVEQVLTTLAGLIRGNEKSDFEICSLFCIVLDFEQLNFANPSLSAVEATLCLVSRVLFGDNGSMEVHNALAKVIQRLLSKVQRATGPLGRILEICVRTVGESPIFSFDDLLYIMESKDLNAKAKKICLAVFCVQLSRTAFEFPDYTRYDGARLQSFVGKVMEIRLDLKTGLTAYKVWLGRLIGLLYCSYGDVDCSSPEWKENTLSLDLVSTNYGENQALRFILDALNYAVKNRDIDLCIVEDSLRLLQLEDSQKSLEPLEYSIIESTKVSSWVSADIDSSISENAEIGGWLVGACREMVNFSGSKSLSAFLPLIEASLDFASASFPFLVLQALTHSPQEAALWLHDSITNDCLTGDSVPAIALLKALLHLRILRPEFFETEFIDWRTLIDCSLSIGLSKTAFMLLECYWTFGSATDKVTTELLERICQKLDDDDLKYGVVKDLSIRGSVLGYERDVSWNSLSYEAAKYDDLYTSSSRPGNGETEGLMNAFMRRGLNGVSQVLYEVGNLESSESRYEFSWKLQQWDIPIFYNGGKHATIFAALGAMSSIDDYQVFSIDRAVDKVAGVLKTLYEHVYDEATSTNHRLSGWLDVWGILGELEEILECFRKDKSHGADFDMYSRLCARSDEWSRYKAFGSTENLVLARHTAFYLLERFRHTVQKDSLNHSISALALSYYSNIARENHEYHKAMAASVKLEALSKATEDTEEMKSSLQLLYSIESAKTLWALGDQSVSIEILRSTLTRLDIEDHNQERLFDVPAVYSTLGQWCSVARYETDEVIRTKYLDNAVTLLGRRRELMTSRNDSQPLEKDYKMPDLLYSMNLEKASHASRAEVYHTFAVFCDEQYNSSTSLDYLENTERLLQQKQREIQELGRLSRTGSVSDKSNAAHYLNKIQKIYEIDESEYRTLRKNMRLLLEKSIEYYMLSIIESEKYIQDISRLCALWLGNSDSKAANQAIAKHVRKLPSKRFVAWMNQLSSRLLSGREKDLFQSNLWELLLNVCEGHPYHTLYSIIGLRMVVVDSQDEQMKVKSHAGHKFWRELIKRKKLNDQLLNCIEKFSQNCVALAQAPVAKRVSHVTFDEVPGRSWWMKTLPECGLPSPTQHIPLRDDGYNDIPFITQVNRSVGIATGLSKPKIVKLTISDGESLQMLVKGGNDDLRQDSIMEQVFDQVNEFMKKNDKARSRNLAVRTYKVVPLGPSAGIIEFVKYTRAFMDIAQPLHAKHFKNDYDLSKCREMMKRVQEKSNRERHAPYIEITKHLHPVMRHYFLESAKFPDDWFLMKTNYCRSTAAISMLGHILGLGDRHCNNILLDSHSGEVVHIDLGIAFDQGKLLRIPETVPFRLTRDIVDGMGITGVDGIFRRCSEITLQVLRNELEHIITILNVLRYDPLYSW